MGAGIVQLVDRWACGPKGIFMVGRLRVQFPAGAAGLFFSLSVLPFTRYLFHSCVTAVACNRPRSFCQKSRWQVTPKHAYILTLWNGIWLSMLSRHSVGTYQGKKLTCNLSENVHLQSSQLAEPLWTDHGLRVELVCANWSPLGQQKSSWEWFIEPASNVLACLEMFLPFELCLQGLLIILWSVQIRHCCACECFETSLISLTTDCKCCGISCWSLRVFFFFWGGGAQMFVKILKNLKQSWLPAFWKQSESWVSEPALPSITRDAATWGQRCCLYLDNPYTPH